jgi:hypothetical protein
MDRDGAMSSRGRQRLGRLRVVAGFRCRLMAGSGCLPRLECFSPVTRAAWFVAAGMDSQGSGLGPQSGADDDPLRLRSCGH